MLLGLKPIAKEGYVPASGRAGDFESAADRIANGLVQQLSAAVRVTW